MYRTCLFCQADLGQNEVIEELPVGRRLAFDQAQGRLWVVCKKCERWNLTPFDDRWEAIERCERLFRDTKRRMSTDNIGLARLPEGLELVRIGEPQRPEFAAWRYGDQFGRRRRKSITWGVAAIAAAVALPVAPQVLGFGASTATALNLLNSLRGIYIAKRVRARLPLAGGVGELPVNRMQMAQTRVKPADGEAGFALQVPENKTNPGKYTEISGRPAEISAALILPHVNADGGKPATVKQAVGLLDETTDLSALFVRAQAATKYVLRPTIGDFPKELRLALEMASHEETERRWLAGELLELEEQWRRAEQLAAIADSLGTGAEFDAQLEALKKKDRP